MSERIPDTTNETPYVQALRVQRNRILSTAGEKHGESARHEMWERMTEHAIMLQEKLGRIEVRKIGAYHMLIGSSLVRTEKDDFDPPDSIASYLDQLEKEL